MTSTSVPDTPYNITKDKLFNSAESPPNDILLLHIGSITLCCSEMFLLCSASFSNCEFAILYLTNWNISPSRCSGKRPLQLSDRKELLETMSNTISRRIIENTCFIFSRDVDRIAESFGAIAAVVVYCTINTQ